MELKKYYNDLNIILLGRIASFILIWKMRKREMRIES